ncbi:MAG: four helix bundle protein [Candidatus Levybacteria bacterium]|nr:four helix bundle protein [Candidatus Levybacteria bacterium]
MEDWSDRVNKVEKGSRGRSGYEYLLAYKVTVPIYDLTVQFCQNFINKWSRTYDQMEQAARSGMQNTAEGNKQQSLKGYIQLTGVSRGSLEELLKDYLSYARQHKLSVWSKERAVREIREIRGIWEIIKATPVLPDSPNFPSLPNDPEIAVNLMITLINQANYLLDKLIISLKDKHMKEGGLSESLYKRRSEYRREKGDLGYRVYKENKGDKI